MTAKSENSAVRIALIVFSFFLAIVLIGALLPKDRYGYPSALSYLFVQGGGFLARWSFVALCIALLHRRSKRRQREPKQALSSVSRRRVRTMVSVYALSRAILPIVVFFAAHDRSSLGEDLGLVLSDLPVTLFFMAFSLGIWRKWKGALYYSRWIFVLGAVQGWATLSFHWALTAGSAPIPIAEFTATVVLLLTDLSMIMYLTILNRRTTLE